jgi:hypothetical protein
MLEPSASLREESEELKSEEEQSISVLLEDQAELGLRVPFILTTMRKITIVKLTSLRERQSSKRS